ncbi:hypothetical protein [Cellulomonas sp. URHE0023]|uniref:hypothetical protein n=1 Tax=Cellulomonas sp. URHE0023 TaxID=1380354 RepID=UPI0012DE5659|nr:hypothetical protein [Cellulomonas sp. URHE0023]
MVAEQFEGAVDRWWETAFPPGSDKPAYDEFKADLVLADLWVADMVLPFVRHGLVRPDPIGVPAELSALHERAISLRLEAVKDSDRLLTEWYVEYATTLREIYSSYLERVAAVDRS